MNFWLFHHAANALRSPVRCPLPSQVMTGSSAALPVPLDSAAIAMFRLVLAEARSLVQQRDVIEAHAHELLGDHPVIGAFAKCLASAPSMR